jgi:signal recognition particle subunit SRP54
MNLVLMISCHKFSKCKKMGNMKDLVGMIPGASKAMKDVEIEDDAFKHIEKRLFTL